MYPPFKTDLSVEFCGVNFAHPFILAAAPPTDDLEMLRDAFRAGWAGAILKTTAVEGTPVPLAYPMMSGVDLDNNRLMGMGNIDLISEHHIDVIEERVRTLKNEFPENRIIISISGQTKEDWETIARRAREVGADLIECSFSCTQGGLGLRPGSMLSQDPVASAKVVGWIKQGAESVPVVIKLTPQVSDIVEIAKAVRGAGANAVCVGNTLPSLMGIDIDNAVPIPNIGGKSTYSGLSGPAVKPISLRCIAEVSRNTNMPIAGSGGAVTWRDALEFIMCGANVVEFCTAVMHYGFDIVTDLKEGLAFYLERRGIAAVRDVFGAALPNIVTHDEIPRGIKWRPVLDQDVCVRCDMCVVACRDGAHRAITADAERIPKFDDEKCVGCGLCSVMCPVHAIEMKSQIPNFKSQTNTKNQKESNPLA